VRLLVSVRDAGEAAIAVRGGAAVIDAKEPARGSLGQVDAETLELIRDAIGPRARMSAALGDVTTENDIAAAFDAVRAPVQFVKLAFRGIHDAPRLATLVREAVRRAEGHPARPRVVAVAYADWRRAESLAPEAVGRIVLTEGTGGLLIDTCVKDDHSLFDFMDLPVLVEIGRALAAEELEFALAGRLGLDEVGTALEAGATIFGVRGAVCQGNRRTLRLVESRVVDLARAIRAAQRRMAG
jgi:uncharacterized protein (UPF0264 family)